MGRLQSKIALITGAASGMGEAATALLLDLGAKVTTLDIASVTAPVERAISVDMKINAMKSKSHCELR